MKKYIKCVKLERGAGRMNGSTVFVEVPPTSKPGPLFRRVVSEERLAALNLSSKFIRTLNLPDLSADQKPSLELLNDLDTDPLKDVQPYGRSSLQDILVARRQYLRLLVAKNKKWKAVGDVLKPKTAQPCPASDLQQLRPVTRSMTNSLKRTSAGRPTTVSILGSTRATSTATITPQRCTRPSDKPYGEPLLQRIPLLAVSGSSVAAQSSSVAGQSRRPIMLSVTGKHTTPVTICQRKRPFVNINGVANSTGGGGIGIGGGGGSGLVPTDAVVASVASSTASAQTLSRKDRIPRPPNAFMLFANEYRKKLSSENPRESNKDISVRLGSMWKVMPKEKKDRYFDLARRVDEEHKRKYPHYVYNPKEARLRKAMRDQIRFRTQSSRAAVASGCAGGGGGIGGGGGRPGGGGGGSAAQPTAPPPPPQQAQHKSIASPQLQSAKLKKGFGSPRQEEINFGVAHRLAEQQRSLQTQQAIRDQVESGLLNSYDEAFVELGTTNTNGYQSVGDLTAWYPLQMQAHDNGLRGWQVTPGQFGSEQGDCITPSPQVSPYGQRLPHMISDAAQQQQLMQKPKSEPYVNLYPGSSGGYPDHIKENNMLPEDHAESQEAALVPTNGPTLENGPPLENGTSSALEDGTCSASIGTPTKLPGFQQAFGSTEIGRFSHEGFFSSQALELQVQVSCTSPATPPAASSGPAKKATTQRQRRSNLSPVSCPGSVRRRPAARRMRRNSNGSATGVACSATTPASSDEENAALLGVPDSAGVAPVAPPHPAPPGPSMSRPDAMEPSVDYPQFNMMGTGNEAQMCIPKRDEHPMLPNGHAMDSNHHHQQQQQQQQQQQPHPPSDCSYESQSQRQRVPMHPYAQMNASPYRHYNHQLMGDVTTHHHLPQHYNEHHYIPNVLPHSWDGGSTIHNHYQSNNHSHPMNQYHQHHNYFSQQSWTHDYGSHQGWGGVSYGYPRAYDNSPSPQLHYNYQRYINEYSRYPGYAWPTARDMNRCDDVVTGY